MGRQVMVVLSVLLVVCWNCCGLVDSIDIAEQCRAQVQQVMPCLDYAGGKADAPTEDCCNSIKDMKDGDPICLCYVKSLAMQETRFLQLPSDRAMRNGTLSFCLELLGISPMSPDASEFTNPASTLPYDHNGSWNGSSNGTWNGSSNGTWNGSSNGTWNGSWNGSSSGTWDHSSSGNTQRPSLGIAMAIVFYIFILGSTCMLFPFDLIIKV